TPFSEIMEQIVISQEFNLDLPTISRNDFNFERRIIAEIERFQQESEEIARARAQKLQALQEERIRKQKEEARKIAP
ncbi:604_t:CDS:2, partial [Acaulospora morrowiae]